MKLIGCKQGSAEWLVARRGKPTASRFADIVTATGKPTTGKARRTYMLELLAERLTGQVTEHYVTAAMQRGIDLEPRARAWYEVATGNAVSQIGFVEATGGRWGCSPDGLTATGGIEIKCLGATAMLDVLESGIIPPDYAVQVQACMWVTMRLHWDFVLWTDTEGIPSVVLPCIRNDAMHAAFDACLPPFCDELDAMEAKIRSIGG